MQRLHYPASTHDCNTPFRHRSATTFQLFICSIWMKFDKILFTIFITIFSIFYLTHAQLYKLILYLAFIYRIHITVHVQLVCAHVILYESAKTHNR